MAGIFTAATNTHASWKPSTFPRQNSGRTWASTKNLAKQVKYVSETRFLKLIHIFSQGAKEKEIRGQRRQEIEAAGERWTGSGIVIRVTLATDQWKWTPFSLQCNFNVSLSSSSTASKIWKPSWQLSQDISRRRNEHLTSRYKNSCHSAHSSFFASEFQARRASSRTDKWKQALKPRSRLWVKLAFCEIR